MPGKFVRILRCRSCSAPLSGFKSQCLYCGTRNDIDRSLLQTVAIATNEPGLDCPICQIAMQSATLDSSDGHPISAYKCGTCFGLFFDLFKLETILTNLAKFGFAIDRKRLDELSGQANTEEGVFYRKCPVCTKLMNRVNFGKRSGVITDRCGDHGTWLDAGELKRLVEWMDAGGSLAHAEFMQEINQQKARRDRREQAKFDRLRRESRKRNRL